MGGWALAALFIGTYLLAGGRSSRYRQQHERERARNWRATRVALIAVIAAYALARLAAARGARALRERGRVSFATPTSERDRASIAVAHPGVRRPGLPHPGLPR